MRSLFLFLGVSLLAYYFPGKILYILWFALMMALTIHFGIHIIQSVVIRKYIPSLITSIICLSISIIVLNNCAGYIEFRFIDAVGSVVAIIAMMVNLRLAHKLMDFYNKKLNLYNL